MKRGHLPVRTCRGCGKKASQQTLDRYVIRAGALVMSRTGVGRGLYSCPEPGCLAKVEKRFNKAKSRIR